MLNYCAWDIEIAGTLEEPAGITCAAIYTSSGALQPFHGPVLKGGEYTEVMLPSDLQHMLKTLYRWDELGYPIVTWNGVGFDWRVFASFFPDKERKVMCAQLALRGIDPAFHFFCSKGFMPGLKAVCEGMSVRGKLEGMDGAQAVTKWKEGRAGQDLVLEYVAQDAIATANVYQVIASVGGVEWITRRGQLSHWRSDDGRILNAIDALALPLPNNSWMTDPWPRDKFVSWIVDLGVL